MKAYIRKSLIFLLFLFICYPVMLIIWLNITPKMFQPNINYKRANTSYTYTRISDIKNHKNVDILFLGSSHTYRGFDTRIFAEHGYSSFNLGSSAQTPIQTDVLIDRYLNIINPKVVIYEVFPTTFMIDGVESSLDIISNDYNDMRSLRMALKINNIITYNTLIYAKILEILNFNKSTYEPTRKGDDMYVSGGYVEKDMSFFNKEEFNIRREKINLREDQLNSFEQIVNKISKNDIELILIYAPITKSHYNNYTNRTHFDSIMSSYSVYYNFNKLIQLNDTLHFYDSNHLNQRGVELFNQKIIQIFDKKNIKIKE